MSGIAGVFLRSHMGWLEPRDHFSMLGALAHRGAKGFEFWTNPNHTMLMLYARSKGGSDRPFFLDADSVLCANLDGRIYNCSDLPDRFRKEGADCFAGLEGGFAFALYDERENALYLVRDK